MNGRNADIAIQSRLDPGRTSGGLITNCARDDIRAFSRVHSFFPSAQMLMTTEE
jgi:hypothetical protein